MPPRSRLLPRRLAAASAALALAAVLPGCAGATQPKALPPAAPELSTPVQAVRSYLAWSAWSMRTGDAEESSPAMTAEESVRIDAYIELQRQRGRRLDGRLDSIAFGTARQEASRAVVPAREAWTYAYVPLSPTATPSPDFRASYDTTYTLVRDRGGWRVDRVETRPLTSVP